MKQKYKARVAGVLVALMVINCSTPIAFAQNITPSPESTQISQLSVDDTADFTIENGILTAYTGNDADVIIPEGVTEIGNGSEAVFDENLESVVIPASVTKIASQAFRNCTELKSVTFTEGGKLTTIGSESFYAANKLESLEIPEGVTSIGNYAFTAMSELKSISLPSTLTTVCEGNWFGFLFTRGTNVAAPNTLTAVNIAEGNAQYRSYDGVVYSADGTTLIYAPAAKQSIDWLAGVKTIAENAFLKTTMETVNLPDGLVTVEDNAFYNAGTSTLTVPGSVKSIGEYAFYYSRIKSISFSEGLTSIGSGAFGECYFPKNTELVLPASLESVGSGAFDCLTDSGSATVKVLGKNTTLESGFIPNSANATLYGLEGSTAQAYVKNLGDTCKIAFQLIESTKETAVASVTLPDTLVLTVGSGQQLTAEVLPEDATDKSLTWESSDDKIATVDQTGRVTAIAAGTATVSATTTNGKTDSCIITVKDNSTIPTEPSEGLVIEDGVLTEYTGNESEVIIPEGVTEIAAGVFETSEEAERADLTKVTIPTSVTKIGDRAFSGCSLTEVTFAPNSALRTLGESAFAYNTKLPEITLPDGLEMIGARAFDGAGRLSSIAIPASVTSIGDYAFELCTGLKNIQFASDQTSQLKTIGEFAFYQCYRLKQIDIPEGVISIGDSALRISRGLTQVTLPSTLEQFGTEAPLVFAPIHDKNPLSGSDELVSITVAEGNQNYSSHDGLLYTADGKTLLYAPAGRNGTVTVADGTEIIGDYAFHRSQASHVVLPESLTAINDNGFSAAQLTSVELPDSITAIGEGAFFNCSALKTVQLGSGLKTIGEDAFSLTDITQITIPAGVTSIGKRAFDFEHGGGNLFVRLLGANTVLADDFITSEKEITIYGPENSTAKAYVAKKQAEEGDKCQLTFQSLDKYRAVTSVTIDQNVLTMKQREKVTLNASVQPEDATHTDLVFKSQDTNVATVNDKGMITAVAPGTTVVRVMSSDGPYAECTVSVVRDETLSDFSIDSRGYITGYTGESADVIVPSTVEGKDVRGIAAGAFRERWDIETVSLPDTLQHIEDETFAYCANLSEITFNAGLKTVGDRAFENCLHLRTVTLPEGLSTLGEEVFSNCESLESAVLPSTLETVPAGAFHTCWRLKEITVPEGVKTIEHDAFYECEAMTSVTLPSTLRTISSHAFTSCVRLTEVTIPEGVERIDKQAFMSCTALATIHLPSTLQALGGEYPGDVFERSDVLGCDHLTKVTVAQGNKNFSSHDGLLYSSDGKTLLFCPRGLTSTTVKEGTEKIGSYALFYCRALENLTLPSSLQEIEDHGISVCESLKKLTLQEGITAIGDDAFAHSSSLVEVNIPDTVQSIGARAFLGTAIETLIIPSAVETIGDEAFAYNQALKSVTIRSSLTDIGDSLFKVSPNVTIRTDSANASIYAYAQDNNIPVSLIESGSGDTPTGGTSTGHVVVSNRTLSFDTNGGSDIDAVKVKNGETVDLADYASKRDGYTFDGWYADKDLTKKIDSIKVTKNTTVYAGWTSEAPTPGGETVLPFTDVKDGDWYEADVRYVYDNKLMNGVSDTAFGAQDATTRGMIATIFHRLAGSPETGEKLVFTDVSPDAWYQHAVCWAKQTGVMAGYSNDIFAPDDAVTREQLAAIFCNHAKLNGSDIGANGDLTTFTDAAQVSDWAQDSVEWAVAKGIIGGKDGNRLDPQGTATRAEISAMIHRYVEMDTK